MSELVSMGLSGMTGAVPLFLVAAGVSITYRVTGTINFALGAFAMLGGYLAHGLALKVTVSGSGIGLFFAIAIAAILVGVLGALMEILLLRRIARSPLPLQLLATFAVALILQDIVLEVWGPAPLAAIGSLSAGDPVSVNGMTFGFYDVATWCVVPLVLAGLWAISEMTPWSSRIRAIIQDPEMAAILGLGQKWVFTAVVALGAALAGLGGALAMPLQGVKLGMAEEMLALGFIAVVIGGLGNIKGAVIGALIVSQFQAFGALMLPEGAVGLLFLTVAVIMAVRPQGLLGASDLRAEDLRGNSERPPTLPRIVFLLITLGAMVILGLVPFLNNPHLLAVVSEILIFVLFAASLQFLVGFGGMASFGHAVYLGIGAYGSALLVRHFALPLEVALLVAPIAAAAGALVMGWFSVRLAGAYIAMVTLAFAQIGWSLAAELTSVTGGTAGIGGLVASDLVANPQAFYALTLGLVALSLYLLRQIAQSPFGLALRATRDSAKRAMAIGIDLQGLRWTAFVLAGGFAGMAGGLLAYLKGAVTPGIMPVATSIDGLVMVALGGLQSLIGPLVGATLYTGLKTQLVNHTEFWRLFIGLVIIALVILLPRGLIGGLSRVLEARR